jgi:type II secretory pathway pseudopilin PulG
VTLRRRLQRLAAAEGGYSLPELVTVCAILGTVLGALTALFVQASNAEVDMNRRFHAQVEARLALDKLRREVHCASTITPQDVLTNSVTITLGSQCKTGSGQFTWCTYGSGSRFALYREAGTTCDNVASVRWADYLTTGPIFTYTKPAGELAKLHVELPVDLDPNRSPPVWKLADDIVLRNSTRS